MKRKLQILIIVLILLVIGISCFSACSKDDPFTAECSQAVFDSIVGWSGNQDFQLRIYNVTGYYNFKHYYRVKFDRYTEEDGWVERDQIYSFMMTSFNATFNEETGPKYFEYYYNEYLEAKDNGVKKVYSASEIEKYLNIALEKRA